VFYLNKQSLKQQSLLNVLEQVYSLPYWKENLMTTSSSRRYSRKKKWILKDADRMKFDIFWKCPGRNTRP